MFLQIFISSEIPFSQTSFLDYSLKLGSQPHHSSQFNSVAQSSDSLQPHGPQHARPPCPSPNSRSPPKLMSIELVMPSNHLTLCRPLLLLPSLILSIRVFSNESALRIRWPKYWSFSFSPSNEHPGLISFRMDWFDLLQSKGFSRVFSNTAIQKHQFFGIWPSLSHPYTTTGKTIALTRQTFVGKVMSATLKLRYLSVLEIIHFTSYLFPRESKTLWELLAFYCFYGLSPTHSKISVTILPITGWSWISPKNMFYKWTWHDGLALVLGNFHTGAGWKGSYLGRLAPFLFTVWKSPYQGGLCHRRRSTQWWEEVREVKGIWISSHFKCPFFKLRLLNTGSIAPTEYHLKKIVISWQTTLPMYLTLS